ncbi:MAG: helix-turn-helix transcriptional regulator [Deltaproteobacteria bacterium]|nr:helix-turn-helix transcriptional regulator [Deltaproteobacteria bacterium]
MNTESRRKRIGAYLRERREKLGITQAALAASVGLPNHMAVSRIENGLVSFPFARANLFADALSLDREEFWRFCGGKSADVEAPPDIRVLGRGTLPPDIVKRLAVLPQSPRFWEKLRSILDDEEYVARLEAGGKRKK